MYEYEYEYEYENEYEVGVWGRGGAMEFLCYLFNEYVFTVEVGRP